jgi:hypothetical protein
MIIECPTPYSVSIAGSLSYELGHCSINAVPEPDEYGRCFGALGTSTTVELQKTYARTVGTYGSGRYREPFRFGHTVEFCNRNVGIRSDGETDGVAPPVALCGSVDSRPVPLEDEGPAHASILCSAAPGQDR